MIELFLFFPFLTKDFCGSSRTQEGWNSHDMRETAEGKREKLKEKKKRARFVRHLIPGPGWRQILSHWPVFFCL